MMEFIEQLPLPPDIQRKIFMLSMPRHPCVYDIKHTRLVITGCSCEGCVEKSYYGCYSLEFNHSKKGRCMKNLRLRPGCWREYDADLLSWQHGGHEEHFFSGGVLSKRWVAYREGVYCHY